MENKEKSNEKIKSSNSDIEAKRKLFDELRNNISDNYSEQCETILNKIKTFKTKNIKKIVTSSIKEFPELPLEKEEFIKTVTTQIENNYKNSFNLENVKDYIVSYITPKLKKDEKITDDIITKELKILTKKPEEIISVDIKNSVSYMMFSYLKQKQKDDELKKLKDENKHLRKSKEKAEDVLVEARDSIKRLKNDYEALRKRTDNEKKETSQNASENILKQMLPVLDMFDGALKFYGEKDKDVFDGIEKIHRKFVEILKNDGLVEINALNQKFDSNFHDALFQEPLDDVEFEKITEIFEKGYMLNDKVLRYSKVKVAVPTEEGNKKREAAKGKKIDIKG